MIVFGCIARNLFGDFTMDNYPVVWADWIRQICLSIILLRGGMELEFEGKGLTVILLTLCPQVVEASVVAILSRWNFTLPWSLCFANGFCLGAVSPAVLVPSIMILIEKKLGTKKGIPLIMLAASSFDDIVAITVFSILVAISFQNIGSGGNNDLSISQMIFGNLGQIVTGIVGAIILGGCMKVFEIFSCTEATKIRMKFIILLFIACFTPYLCYLTGFQESKYIGIISFGYVCYRVWGENKPDK
jgi:solute carrier family 9B (sodium/hydrogen exchanger), member 1/2